MAGGWFIGNSFYCICESVDGPPAPGKAESAKSCVRHDAQTADQANG